MIFVDDILTYFRNLGHAAEYGTLEQLNEQLTSVDYSAGTDGMVAFVRLIGEQRTVNGHDQCDIAVHLSWLCPLDFSGEDLLSTQEKAKDTLKTWLQYMRDGNTVTVSTDARWQFGYDDFAENVAWVAVRVTLTTAAADCVPFAPSPTPPERYLYNYFCPQVIRPGLFENGRDNPVCQSATRRYACTIATPFYNASLKYIIWVGSEQPMTWGGGNIGDITESNITTWKSSMESIGRPMTQETEDWLRERIGQKLLSYNFTLSLGHENVLAAYSADNYETKEVTVL